MLGGRAAPDGIPALQLHVNVPTATALPTTSASLSQLNPRLLWLWDFPSAKPGITERNKLVLYQASFHGLLPQCCWLLVLLCPTLPVPRCLNSFGGGFVLSRVQVGRKEASKGP